MPQSLKLWPHYLPLWARDWWRCSPPGVSVGVLNGWNKWPRHTRSGAQTPGIGHLRRQMTVQASQALPADGRIYGAGGWHGSLPSTLTPRHAALASCLKFTEIPVTAIVHATYEHTMRQRISCIILAYHMVGTS